MENIKGGIACALARYKVLGSIPSTTRRKGKKKGEEEKKKWKKERKLKGSSVYPKKVLTIRLD